MESSNPFTARCATTFSLMGMSKPVPGNPPYAALFSNSRFFAAVFFFGILSTCFHSAKGAALEGAFAPVPDGSNINLTAEGTADWAHWGLNGAGSFNRKQGVAPQISNFTL